MTARVVATIAHAFPNGVPVGVLYGTTAVAGFPDATVQRRVHLVLADNPQRLLLPGARLVAWKFSDAFGNWHFDGLDPTLRYHAIAYDHTGVHDPVIKMNLVPTVD
jgi:hypothetical protein